jgi:maltose O-acetyltransferase
LALKGRNFPAHGSMTSEREKMLAGELYDAMDPELAAARERARGLCARINGLPHDDARRRESLQQLLGAGGNPCKVVRPLA